MDPCHNICGMPVATEKNIPNFSQQTTRWKESVQHKKNIIIIIPVISICWNTTPLLKAPSGTWTEQTCDVFISPKVFLQKKQRETYLLQTMPKVWNAQPNFNIFSILWIHKKDYFFYAAIKFQKIFLWFHKKIKFYKLFFYGSTKWHLFFYAAVKFQTIFLWQHKKIKMYKLYSSPVKIPPKVNCDTQTFGFRV